jgi:hypothetical protein
MRYSDMSRIPVGANLGAGQTFQVTPIPHITTNKSSATSQRASEFLVVHIM